MFGTYQHSELRIEVAASAVDISSSITQLEQLKRWLWPQQIKGADVAAGTLSTGLSAGQIFKSGLGPVSTTHQVELISPTGIRFLLSGSVDGFHEWQWGDGWVQSRLEGVSLLPLNLGQTLSLVRLKQHLASSQEKETT